MHARELVVARGAFRAAVPGEWNVLQISKQLVVVPLKEQAASGTYPLTVPFLKTTQADLGPNAERIALASIEATMLWPDDQQRRHEVEMAANADDLARLVQSFGSLGDAYSVPAATVVKIVEVIQGSPRLKDIQETVKAPFIHGVMVGFVLKLVIGYSQLRSPRAQLTRVKADVAKMFGVSVSAINNIYWPRNKCVAPLWAAYTLLAGRDYDNGKDIVFPCRLAELSDFLAISEWYRRNAESLRTKQSRRGTLLKPGESWAPDPRLALPEVHIEHYVTKPKSSPPATVKDSAG